MSRKLALLLAAVFLFTVVAPVFAQTEDEIVARYLKKAEKKQHQKKVGFVTAGFSYGKLGDNTDYNKFSNYANANITPCQPVEGIWRSRQFNASFGMLLSQRTALHLGFEYWLKLGSNESGDYTMGIAPLGAQTDFDLQSEVQVFGITSGVDYYFLNPPTREGVFNSLALRLSGEGGLYFASWDIWDGASSFNLATASFENNREALKGTSVGGTVALGADYPTPLFGTLLAVDVSYTYLNFSKVKSYNSVDEELHVSYTASGDNRVELDFSGLRGKIQLKKFFRW